MSQTKSPFVSSAPLPPSAARRPPYRRRGFAGAVLGWFSSLLRFVLATALFFVLMVLASYWVVARLIGGSELKAPDLTGKTLHETIRMLKKDNLSVQWERDQPHDQLGEGKIISQFPTPGAVIKAGTPLRVVVSAGTAKVEVPELRGESKISASLALSKLGLSVGTITGIPSSGSAVGKVLGTDPPGKTGVPQGSKINLLISTGQIPTIQPMPKIQGLTIEQAREELARFGLMISEERKEPAAATAPDQVFKQFPAPGEPVTETTSILVSYAPPAETEAEPETEEHAATPAGQTKTPTQPVTVIRPGTSATPPAVKLDGAMTTSTVETTPTQSRPESERVKPRNEEEPPAVGTEEPETDAEAGGEDSAAPPAAVNE